MRVLIAEDDYVSRKFILKFLSKYGVCDVTVNGKEAVEAFIISVETEEYYDLICLDIMMPELDGTEVLKVIKKMEIVNEIKDENKSKIIMMTALSDVETIKNAYKDGSHGYAVKPLDTEKIEKVLRKLELIE
jgi:two-component system chemotaxis response regulator CheY